MSKPKQPAPEPIAPIAPIASIDPAALAAVTGGSVSGDTQGLLTQLTGILDSVKSISTAGAAQGINPTEMIMMMFMLRNQQQPQVVAYGAPQPNGYWVVNGRRGY